MSTRLCVIAMCVVMTACSRTIRNSFTVLGTRGNQNAPVGASGIARCGDFYIVSDRCHTLQRYNAGTDRFFSIRLAGVKDNAKLNGVAAFRNMLYATDEANNVVYRIDTTGSVRATFAIALPSGTRRRFYLKGLAISTTHELAYVVRHYDRLVWKRAHISTYRIKTDSSGNIVGLGLIADTMGVTIRHMRGFRYTDITYDDQLTRLVLIRNRNRKHVIDEMEINEITGQVIQDEKNGCKSLPGFRKVTGQFVSFSFRKVADVSREVHACRGYSTKIEAIATDRSGYYVMSSSAKGTRCRANTKHRTLFMRIVVPEGPVSIKVNPPGKP